MPNIIPITAPKNPMRSENIGGMPLRIWLRRTQALQGWNLTAVGQKGVKFD